MVVPETIVFAVDLAEESAQPGARGSAAAAELLYT
jgi:hypothetical protein